MDVLAESEAAWVKRIDAARRQGDHFAAYDLARRAAAAWPGRLRFEHQAILALARAGASAGAMARYERLRASGALEALNEPGLAAEFAGLGGRLFKDLAAISPPVLQADIRRQSAQLYEDGFQRFGGHYLAVNAASMYLAAGDPIRARTYAAQARDAAASEPPHYWQAATLAEALLILGETEAAAAALREAAAHGAGNLDALASTRRQMDWIASLLEAPGALLENLPGPLVLTWQACQPAVTEVSFPPGRMVLAFGPLLSLADVATASALRAAGATLSLVLPCAPSHLAGRLGAAQEAVAALLEDPAATALQVTQDGGQDEPAAALLCQLQAQGLALLRARNLAVEAQSLMPSGALERLAPDGGGFGLCVPVDYPVELVRQPKAILFGDVRGFSKLSEAQQLAFLEHVIGGFADVLAGFPALNYAETAGDGLFLVLGDVLAAVECALALRRALPGLAAQAGLGRDLSIRLSAHVGPLYQRFDRVIGRDKFCGMEVIRTARIEPVTPPGEIFVTEQFAATLASQSVAFVCEYAGVQPMAKGFGECRMYSLRPAMVG